MKGRIAVTMVGIALLIGGATLSCAPKIKKPEIKVPIPKKYELKDLYLTTDAKQMTGTARDMAKLGIGETVVIYARGNMGGEWFELPADIIVNWKADPELEVTPTTGPVVTVKVIKPISTSSYVEATTTTKEDEKVKKLFTIIGK